VSTTNHKAAASCARSAKVIDPEEMERLSHVVARLGSDAMLIDRDNRSFGCVPIAVAVRSGSCFAVKLADNMVGIDADTSRAVHWVRNSLIDQLARLKIPSVVLNSGRPGHLHLFALVPDSNLKQEIEVAARFAGCDVRTGQRIRPPLSPHRLGFPVSLVTPLNPAEALSALSSISKRKSLAVRYRRPSERIFALLKNGDCDHRYHSRSEVIQAIALAAVNQGYSEEWVFTVLHDPANRAGEKIQLMRESDARRYVGRAYGKAQACAVAHPSFRVQGEAVGIITEKIDLAAPEMLLSLGSGQAGATDYSVLTAYLFIARRLGPLEFGASDREIVELSGLSRPTITESRKRLILSGFLKRVRRPMIGSTSASRWQLRLPVGDVASVTNPALMGGVRPTGKPTTSLHPAPIFGFEEASANPNTGFGRFSQRHRPPLNLHQS
jgi:hypothetical protein